jgi:hypothetical protein
MLLIIIIVSFEIISLLVDKSIVDARQDVTINNSTYLHIASYYELGK